MINLFRNRTGAWPCSLNICRRNRTWMTRCNRKLTTRSLCSGLMNWNFYRAVFVNLLTFWQPCLKWCTTHTNSVGEKVIFSDGNQIIFFLSFLFPYFIFFFYSSSYLCPFFYFHTFPFLSFSLSLYNRFLTSCSISSFAAQIYVRRWISAKQYSIIRWVRAANAPSQPRKEWVMVSPCRSRTATRHTSLWYGHQIREADWRREVRVRVDAQGRACVRYWSIRCRWLALKLNTGHGRWMERRNRKADMVVRAKPFPNAAETSNKEWMFRDLQTFFRALYLLFQSSCGSVPQRLRH